MTVVGQVEINEFCRQVLAKHWPEVPRHDDVTTAVDWWTGRPRPAVDVVAGGFPCQPFSKAGRRLAQSDARWLWPAMADVIDAVRPRWVVGENVPGLLDATDDAPAGVCDVVADLEGLGYVCRVGSISACEVGAPHPRRRVFVLAHPGGEGRCPGRPERRGAVASPGGPEAVGGVAERGRRWAREPDVDRVAYGLPGGVDRRRALGNAVSPQVAEYIGRLITHSEGR
ncbi:DNA cytosine methyltransferase [Longispora sp. K20-0274]|uniref:DNA cytosine methyltransferase n=1 Tax=Longispora sp. K20-0274 TaxID=3088255 RepID=UPI00399C471A